MPISRVRSVCHDPIDSAVIVGRTPWSAADPPVGLSGIASGDEERVQGDPRGPGGPARTRGTRADQGDPRGPGGPARTRGSAPQLPPIQRAADPDEMKPGRGRVSDWLPP